VTKTVKINGYPDTSSVVYKIYLKPDFSPILPSVLQSTANVDIILDLTKEADPHTKRSMIAG
jgi:hypothetical protein